MGGHVSPSGGRWGWGYDATRRGCHDRIMSIGVAATTSSILESTREIGIVAIGRNEGARLEPCLKSLLSHSTRVIYADSASSDGSADVARRLGVEVVELSADIPLSAAAGRAAGYAALRSRYPNVEFVQFVDGDCLLDPAWLGSGATFLNARINVGVVCGRRREADPEASLYNAMADAEWDTPIGQSRACGGDALYRVAAYEQAGGFRSDLLAGEEPELCTRLTNCGWEIWRIDVPMTEHDARMLHFSQWWRRSQRGGYGYAQVWDVTRTLYGRQVLSALAWAVGMPLLFVVAASFFASPWILAGIPSLYLVQTTRIHFGFSDKRPRRLARAALTLLAKVPETLGALRYLARAARPTMGSRK